MTEKLMIKCDLCGRQFQFGPHRYDGKYIKKYKMNACDSCYENNRDGWAPHLEGKFLSHLKEKGVPIPERNEKGWFPRD